MNEMMVKSVENAIAIEGERSLRTGARKSTAPRPTE